MPCLREQEKCQKQETEKLHKIMPSIDFNAEYALSSSQMREVDKVAVEQFNLRIMQMMELAAYLMATLVREVIPDFSSKKVLVVAGKGNNGGDAIASARHFANWGAKVTILVPEKVNVMGAHHLELAKRMDVEIIHDLEEIKADIVIDGILGYSLVGNVREPFKTWIEKINKSKAMVFSYDIPSGLDPDDGTIHGVVVNADYTLTLTYPKKGLFVASAEKYVGKLYLGDIGIPEIVYARVKGKFPRIEYKNPFRKALLVKVDH